MPESNKLSIYLIKDEFSNDDKVILKNSPDPLTTVDGLGVAYYCPSQTVTPKWVSSFFCNQIDKNNIFTSNARAVLIARVKIDEELKTFAITMGQGKHMLANDVIEDDFGLKIVLNTIEPNSLRRINKINIGGNQKTSNEQLPLASDIDDFGFDIDRDLIGTVTGYSNDDTLATGILTGGELFSLTAPVDITNLKEFLGKAYRRYRSTSYRNNFGWIDHIKKVKDSRIITALETEIIRLINEESPTIWMAVPDVISWENIVGFKYNGKELYTDIYIKTVTDSFRNGLTSFEQLKQKTIFAIDAQDGVSTYLSWQAHKCLYGEIEYGGKAYCINNGRWFCVDKDFVSMVNNAYEQIAISNMTFLDCTKKHNSENAYSKDFVSTDEENLLCMDKQNISYGGGQSKVELCDILTTDNTYIHIKPYSGSATLSHLFNQAVVSAELVLGDSEFRAKANIKIKELTNNQSFQITEGNRPNVILGIISEKDVERPQIPFFSKVALRYTKRRLETFGCELSIKNIHKIS